MLKQFFHDTLKGDVSFEWHKRNSVKYFDKPKLIVCLPVGSKLSQNVHWEAQDGKLEAVADTPGIRIPATVPVQWLTSQMQMIHPLNTTVVYLSQFGMYAGQARQVLTTRALELLPEDGYVLYWDDDNIADQTAMYTMMGYMEQHPEVGLLSAVYCTREPPNEPVIYNALGRGVNWSFTMGPDVEPQEIFSCGAGFMLVRAAAIRRAVEMNPDEPVWADMKISTERPDEAPDPTWGKNTTWGHDTRFCRLIADAGYKVMVDGRVEVGHLDIATQVVHTLPDNSPPKQRGLRYRGEQYWNRLYTKQGVEQINMRGKLLINMLGAMRKHSKVVEVGCGTGAVGQLLSAQGGCEWTGFDLSEVAVQACNARFLNAYKKHVHELTPEDVAGADYIVALELDLLEEDQKHLYELAQGANVVLVTTAPKGTPCPANVVKRDGDEELDLWFVWEVRDATGSASAAVLQQGLGAGGGRSEVVQDGEPAKAGAVRSRSRRRNKKKPIVSG